MNARYLAPGVYPDEIFLKPQVSLPTGVAGFAGFADLADASSAPRAPVALHHEDDFAHYFRARADSYLEASIAGYFRNGGESCYVARADGIGDAAQSLMRAVEALASIDELDLVVVPDAMTLRHSELRNSGHAFSALRVEAIEKLQRSILEHCAKQADRFAILDSLPAFACAEGALPTGQSLKGALGEEMNGALYFPWLKVEAGASGTKLLPPSGHVAGIYARSDARTGMHKAPANEELLGVLDLEIAVTGDMATRLNPAGVNALRIFPERGIRVWGARTLSIDGAWRYVNVRRLFITLRRWIHRNMAWATFEPNTPALWMRIERELGAYLDGLWRAGALQGTAPQQAYYVKCNAETNLANGPSERVVTEIGLAASIPAEFVVVRIVHRPGNPNE